MTAFIFSLVKYRVTSNMVVSKQWQGTYLLSYYPSRPKYDFSIWVNLRISSENASYIHFIRLCFDFPVSVKWITSVLTWFQDIKASSAGEWVKNTNNHLLYNVSY